MRADTEIATLLFPAFVNRTTREIVLLALFAAVGVPLFIPLAVVGQEATPAPAACDVEPRPITFIADLLAAPKPEVTPTPVTGVPEGIDVTDPEVRAAVVSVVETLIVCVNQGDLLRSFSLFDDEYLRRVIDPEGLMREDVAVELAKSMATPVAVDAKDVTTLEDILMVRELPDGTVAVVFRTRGGLNRDPDQSQVDLFVLRKDGERWLIVDGLTDLDPESIPTPAA
jgi:hypothetical protein